MNHEIKRGKVFLVDLGDARGSEVSKVRPAVIISNDIGNHHSATVTILPLTSSKKHLLPTHIKLDKPSLKGIVQSEQIRTVDKMRVLKHVGCLSSNELLAVEKGLRISLGI